jgi:hypothetical protein
MTVTVIGASKGGQGATTIAAVLAVTSAQHTPTILLDTTGDAASVLGLATQPAADNLTDALDRTADAMPGLRVARLPADRIDTAALDTLAALSAAGRRVIVDTGTDHTATHRLDPLHPSRYLVVRPCYLAVSRAVAVPYTPDHVILVREPLRALTAQDVEHALALPVTAVPYDPVIARAIDAGLLTCTAYRLLGRPLRHLC